MKKAYLSGLFILLFALVVITQIFYDSKKAKAQYNEPFILSPKIIEKIDLGLHNAASDLYWIATIQYFGGFDSKTNEKLPEYLDTVTKLDPQFSYPYAFGVLILPTIKQTDQAIELGQKGIDLKLPNWKIPYYLATVYFIDKNDSANAAKYFDIAAHTEGAPESTAKVAASYGARSEKRAQTIQIWTGIYETTNDEVIRERAKKYLVHYQILDILDQAVEYYRNKNNKLPDSIEELVRARIINQIPEDPFGFQYNIGKDGKVVLK